MDVFRFSANARLLPHRPRHAVAATDRRHRVTRRARFVPLFIVRSSVCGSIRVDDKCPITRTGRHSPPQGPPPERTHAEKLARPAASRKAAEPLYATSRESIMIRATHLFPLTSGDYAPTWPAWSSFGADPGFAGGSGIAPDDPLFRFYSVGLSAWFPCQAAAEIAGLSVTASVTPQAWNLRAPPAARAAGRHRLHPRHRRRRIRDGMPAPGGPERFAHRGIGVRRHRRPHPGAVPAGNRHLVADQRVRHQPGPDRRLLPAVVDRRAGAVPFRIRYQHDPRQRRRHRNGHAVRRGIRRPADLRHHLVQAGLGDRQQHLPQQLRQQRRVAGRAERAEGDLGPGAGESGRHAERRLQRHRQRRQPDDRHGGAGRPGHDLDLARVTDRAAIADLYQRRRPDRDGHAVVRRPAVWPGQRPRLHVPEPDDGRRRAHGAIAEPVGHG